MFHFLTILQLLFPKRQKDRVAKKTVEKIILMKNAVKLFFCLNLNITNPFIIIHINSSNTCGLQCYALHDHCFHEK